MRSRPVRRRPGPSLRRGVPATVVIALLALVAPAAIVPDAQAGMPTTDLTTQRVALVPVAPPPAVGGASEQPTHASEQPGHASEQPSHASEQPSHGVEAEGTEDGDASHEASPTPDQDHGPDHGDGPSGWHLSEGAPTTMADAAVATVSEELAVEDVLMVGATWDGAAAVEVRSGKGGEWSNWIPLVRGGSEHVPDQGSAEAADVVEEASDPVFVGGAERVQFRSDALDGVDVTFVEVVGGEGLEWTPESANSAASAQADPIVRSRADWGADESLRDGRVEYSSTGGIRFSVVHHVGGGYWSDGEIANGCARSDDWIRGIYAYHVQARGFWDIGYNFVVDPCGNIWEGRHGGVLEPVVGAHAGGFNDGSVGVLALGTFSGSTPDTVTTAMVDSLEEIIGFKLGRHDADPAGTTSEVSGGSNSRWPEGTEVTVPVLSAHQTSSATTCPGDALMAKLFQGTGHSAGPLGSFIAGVQDNLVSIGAGFTRSVAEFNGWFDPLAGDFDGNGMADLFMYAPGTTRDWILSSTPDGFVNRRTAIDGDFLHRVGDFNGDGRDDILWYAPGTAPDMVQFGTPTGFETRTMAVDGTYDPIIGDFDGDGRDDLFWYAPGPARDHMWLGRDGYGFRVVRSPQPSGTMTPLAGAFDARPGDDIIWYGPGSAPDSYWSSDGDATFTPAKLSLTAVYDPVVGDFDGNGMTDIFWFRGGQGDHFWMRRPDGKVTKQAVRVSPATAGVRLLVADFDGTGVDDILFYHAGPATDEFWLR